MLVFGLRLLSREKHVHVVLEMMDTVMRMINGRNIPTPQLGHLPRNGIVEAALLPPQVGLKVQLNSRQVCLKFQLNRRSIRGKVLTPQQGRKLQMNRIVNAVFVAAYYRVKYPITSTTLCHYRRMAQMNVWIYMRYASNATPKRQTMNILRVRSSNVKSGKRCQLDDMMSKLLNF